MLTTVQLSNGALLSLKHLNDQLELIKSEKQSEQGSGANQISEQ
jgi:hypothetical protein